MKLLCYRTLNVHPGVEALDLVEVDLPLADVMECGVVSLDADGAFPFDNPQGPGHCMALPTPFAVREADGCVTEMRGFLIAHGDRRLVEFLAEKFASRGHGFLDQLVRSTPREEMEDEIRRYLDRPRSARHRRRHITLPAPYVIDTPEGIPTRELLIDKARVQEELVDPHVMPGHYLRRVDEGLHLVVETAACGAHRVPRRKHAIVHPDGSTPCIWFDGARDGCAPSWEQVPRALREELDAKGRPLASAIDDPLPGRPLEALFLVRIPSRAELPDLRPKALPPGLAGRPLFLVDSRAPIPLPAGIEVLADPAHGLALLERTVDGIYVPDDAAREDVEAADGPGWMIACRMAS